MALRASLVRGAKEQDEFNHEQEHLKEKYHVDEKEVVVVEKSNMIKFFIRYGVLLFHLLFRLVLIVLAVTGLLAILYPSTRMALWEVVTDIQRQLLSFI